MKFTNGLTFVLNWIRLIKVVDTPEEVLDTDLQIIAVELKL